MRVPVGPSVIPEPAANRLLIRADGEDLHVFLGARDRGQTALWVDLQIPERLPLVPPVVPEPRMVYLTIGAHAEELHVILCPGHGRQPTAGLNRHRRSVAEEKPDPALVLEGRA